MSNTGSDSQVEAEKKDSAATRTPYFTHRLTPAGTSIPTVTGDMPRPCQPRDFARKITSNIYFQLQCVRNLLRDPLPLKSSELIVERVGIERQEPLDPTPKRLVLFFEFLER